MHFSSLMTTLNPMTETTKRARLIQSPALIVTGSCVLITDKGARVATFALMTCDEFLGAERDLRTGATLLPWAILQPPHQPDGRCSQMPNPPARPHNDDSSITPKRYRRWQPQQPLAP